MPDPRHLVERFYHELWDGPHEPVAHEILDPEFQFRGSLGPVRHGPEGFLDYWRSIHRALGGYKSRIEDLITTETRAAARMTFSGIHQDDFFGVKATGKEISWAGGAFFTTNGQLITELWVLGDIDAIKRQLGIDSTASFSSD